MLKPELQAKFLQHLNNRKKKNEEGFTLIELLVVVIIIGVLAAIALPSLLGQVNKAKQSEARNYVGTVNRSQQAYFLEYQKFATNLSELQVGIKSQTDNYLYTVTSGLSAVGAFTGTAYKNALKSYYGVVGTTTAATATSESLTLAIACESAGPTTGVATLTDSSSFTGCQTNYVSLSR
ncbi:type IV pilin-like G/H family protein [Pelatocladus sp. BLCC-F211]|uniref:type IV pilin-like G/H family protein n=1 Tax=Pelatocladus sp. BLCC-F211 TaxID=3342752 RepID=UPI0035B892D7